jgi:hypothetical protein
MARGTSLSSRPAAMTGADVKRRLKRDLREKREKDGVRI